MAGASLEIHIDDRQVRDGLAQLQARLSDLSPVFQDIGEALLNSTRERFHHQTAPDGSSWAALSPDYQARKKKNANLILTLNGYLRGTLNYQASKQELRVGTPLIYGATHQFGRPEKNIPARPFLGLSADDRTMIQDALQEWLRGDFT
jgi:phage virion morphogenesis protein